MGYRKVHVCVSLDDEEYQEYRTSLKGTRFDRNGNVNASAALRYHIQSVNEERKKQESPTQEQIHVSESSDMLQSTDEYVTKQIIKLLEFKTDVTDDIIAEMEQEVQRKIYNHFNQINRCIVRRLGKRFDDQNEEEKKQQVRVRVATEQEVRMLKFYEGRPEQEVISVVKVLRREIEEGKVKIEVTTAS
jgi:hypothetical protein